jgi:hypothetical protein
MWNGATDGHAGREGTNMALQHYPRSDFWWHVWFAPVYFLMFGLGLFVIIFLVGLFIPGEKGFDTTILFFLVVGLSLVAGAVRGKEIFDLGCGFKCFCGQFYANNTPWVCGYCHEINIPDYSLNRYNHFLRHCVKCRSIPLGLWCNSCQKIIQLTKWAVDLVRYARVHGPAPVETPEILQLRHQQEIERVRRQYQEELEREQRRARAKQMSSNLEILAEKIKTTKQFELDALTMVRKLKEAGTLDDYEEKVLLEMIRDKVLEEFHVDRRGGRSRHQS